MALTSGTKLGPYEILSAIGAGGMGEVYRALDARLERTVAIKVLPSQLSSNPELRARFEREAKAISGLQHPHICVLHDVGSQDGVDFLVMEYLEGETLYARLARKPLSADETLKIAIEIADALEKAHRSGIIHRDLKPGNVMLTRGGAKLMDFGLAKPQGIGGGPASASAGLSAVATMAATVAELASPVTVAGTLVGTVQYMSPEQIQGKEADARSDIFAFGAMLYEMLTGKRAFQGKSQLSLASAILERDPEPISQLQPMTPPVLDQIIRTCLAKDPDDRFQSAHDLKLQLQWAAAGGSRVGVPIGESSQRKKITKPILVAIAAGWLIALAAGILLLENSSRLSEARQTLRASIEVPSGYALQDVIFGAPALSPNAQQLVMVAIEKSNDTGGSSNSLLSSLLLLRQLNTGTTTAIKGTERGSFPFWSPDGRYVGFFANGKLRKVEVGGGPVQVLCDAQEGRGGSWNQNGTIVFAPAIAGALLAVSDGGGTPTVQAAARKDAVDFTNRNPIFLPDGKHYLFTARGGNEALGSLYAGSLGGGEPQQILSGASNVAYSNGYLFYLREGTLTAQKFDAGKVKLEDKPVSIAANIEYYNPRDLGYFAVSGNILVFHSAVVRNRDLEWLDVSGKELEHWGEPAPYLGGNVSPNGRMAILYRANPNGRGNSLWLADIERKTVTRLSDDSEMEQSGIVAPDGESAFLAATSGYNSTLARRWLNASGKEEKLMDEPRGFFTVNSMSRDGRYVFFSQQDSKTSFDLYYMDLQGEKTIVPLLNSAYAEADGRLSPDGKWLAYVSNETGKMELYVTPFPHTAAKWQVSSGGVAGTDQRYIVDWSPDGKNLMYQNGDAIYKVDVHAQGEKIEFSSPKELLKVPGNISVLALLPDGKRILAARTTGDDTHEPIDFILNWQSLVKQ